MANEVIPEENQVIDAETNESKYGFIMTSVKLTPEDYQYCKNNRLKFSELLRNAIAHHKAVESGAIVQNVNREREKREKFQEMFYKLKEFIDAKGLTEEWLKDGS